MTNHSKYQAVLFDMDGVVADTKEWVVSAFHHTARAHSFCAHEDRLIDLFGMPLEACYQLIVENCDPHVLTVTHRTFQRDNLHLIRSFPGVEKVLNQLRDEGIPMGIVTGRPHESARLTLEILGLLSFFDVLIGSDDTVTHKPDPEPIQTALAHLKIPAENTVMIGDAPSDIICGQRAGCDTAGALYGFVGEDLAKLKPTYLLNQPIDILTILSG